MKHKILMVVALLVVTSCMKLKKKDEESVLTAPQVQVQQAKVEKPFVNERTELDYEYEISEDGKELPAVRFLASADWPAEIQVIKKSDKEGEKEEQKTVQFNDKAEWKDFLTSENKVSYKFFSKVGNQSILLDEVEVLPALDLKLTDDLSLPEKYKLNSKTKVIYIRNLEINAQKHLYLNDYSGQIIIENITSSGGIIQAFAPSARAAVDQDGRSGGQVSLSILAGAGLLSVVMKGENGGNGSQAKAPDISKKGSTGVMGNIAGFSAVTCNPNLLDGYSDLPLCMSLPYSCAKNPTDGGQGLKGYAGNNGRIGGNSGSILLYNDSDVLKVSITTQMGSFGVSSRGGAGGQGGDGGLGGDGADSDLSAYLKKLGIPVQFAHATLVKACPAAKNGNPGLGGADGDPGYDGENGKNQLSCIYLHDQKVKCINE